MRLAFISILVLCSCGPGKPKYSPWLNHKIPEQTNLSTFDSGCIPSPSPMVLAKPDQIYTIKPCEEVPPVVEQLIEGKFVDTSLGPQDEDLGLLRFQLLEWTKTFLSDGAVPAKNQIQLYPDALDLPKQEGPYPKDARDVAYAAWEIPGFKLRSAQTGRAFTLTIEPRNPGDQSALEIIKAKAKDLFRDEVIYFEVEPTVSRIRVPGFTSYLANVLFDGKPVSCGKNQVLVPSPIEPIDYVVSHGAGSDPRFRDLLRKSTKVLRSKEAWYNNIHVIVSKEEVSIYFPKMDVADPCFPGYY